MVDVVIAVVVIAVVVVAVVVIVIAVAAIELDYWGCWFCNRCAAALLGIILSCLLLSIRIHWGYYVAV